MHFKITLLGVVKDVKAFDLNIHAQIKSKNKVGQKKTTTSQSYSNICANVEKSSNPPSTYLMRRTATNNTLYVLLVRHLI